jgi:hypothetical protein
MKKELSPPQTIAVVAVFVVLVVTVGWWWINRTSAPPDSALGTMQSTVPGQQGGGDPNASTTNPGTGPQMAKPNT